MANIRITELPSLTGANSAADDVTPVVDVSGNITSKMTRDEFFKNIPNLGVAGNILDTNGNELITLTKVTSAVNQVAIVNSSTGNPPQVNAVGGDTNISLVLTSKGTGFIHPIVNSSVTNAPIETMRLSARTNGVPATGIGSVLTFAAETSDNNYEIGARIEAITTDVTLNTEDFDLVFKLMANGATATEIARLTSTGDFLVSNGKVSASSSFVETGPNTTPLNNVLVAYRAGNGVETGNPAAIRVAGDAAGNVAAMTIELGAAERVRFLSDGKVGVGTSSPVTPLHVVGDGIFTGEVYFGQPAQTSKAAAATLTVAELLTNIIQYTGAAANLTLPTGTAIEGGLPATFPTNMSFDLSVINTGSGAATIVTNTGLTLVGSMSVAAGSSGMFRIRKTATNTYTVYRIS